jgi:hypothetical protein
MIGSAQLIYCLPRQVLEELAKKKACQSKPTFSDSLAWTRAIQKALRRFWQLDGQMANVVTAMGITGEQENKSPATTGGYSRAL